MFSHTYRNLIPILYTLDPRADILELRRGLLQQPMHALAQARVIAAGTQETDLGAQLGDVALQVEQFVHQVLGQAGKLGIVGVSAAAAAAAIARGVVVVVLAPAAPGFNR